MRVIGVDPGSRVTGYGAIEYDGTRMIALDYGCVAVGSISPLSRRYIVIYEALEGVISRFAPQEMAVEASFHCKNVASAFKLSQVRGVILLVGARSNLDIYEYSPRKVKESVVGRGSAAKVQIQRMVAEILSLEDVPASEDAGDALAVAICHIHCMGRPDTRGKAT